MSNYKIEICEEMKKLLDSPVATIKTEQRISYGYDLEMFGKHLSNCSFCQNRFAVFYSKLDLPLFVKSLADSYIKKILTKKE